MVANERRECTRKPELLSDEEYRLLYLCDDGIGFVGILAAHLFTSEDRTRQLLRKLTTFGLVMRPDDGGSEFYHTTAAGKLYMKEKARHYAHIAPEEL